MAMALLDTLLSSSGTVAGVEAVAIVALWLRLAAKDREVARVRTEHLNDLRQLTPIVDSAAQRLSERLAPAAAPARRRRAEGAE